jgi:hypothetical protein
LACHSSHQPAVLSVIWPPCSPQASSCASQSHCRHHPLANPYF